MSRTNLSPEQQALRNEMASQLMELYPAMTRKEAKKRAMGIIRIVAPKMAEAQKVK